MAEADVVMDEVQDVSDADKVPDEVQKSIDSLPPEILSLILRSLPLHNKYAVQRVSKKWCEASKLAIRRQERLLISIDHDNRCRAGGGDALLHRTMAYEDVMDTYIERRLGTDVLSLSRLPLILEDPFSYFNVDLICGLKTLIVLHYQPASPVLAVITKIIEASSASLVRMYVPERLISQIHSDFIQFSRLRFLHTDTFGMCTSFEQFPSLEKLKVNMLANVPAAHVPSSLISLECQAVTLRGMADGIENMNFFGPEFAAFHPDPIAFATRYPWFSQVCYYIFFWKLQY